MRRFILYVICIFLTGGAVCATDPTETVFSLSDCRGTYKPYPIPREAVDCPDSLMPAFINHVGRHGARFPSSAKNVLTLLDALRRADSIGTITSEGRELMALSELLVARGDGRWGALDSLGMAEQRGIASRMYMNFPSVFTDGVVKAVSSYSPRCVMSMYEFTHQLDRLNNKMEIYTSAGRQNSSLMRYFDTDKEFVEFRRSDVTETADVDFFAVKAVTSPLRRILGDGYPYGDDEDMRLLAYVEYRVVASMAAAGIECDMSHFFTIEEANALWACLNLKHYLGYSSTTISTVPSDAASPLLLNLIETMDAAVEERADATVMLRFGHAETLMPLLALMRLDGCYYMTNYFDTVAKNWQDFRIVPMGANLQMILLRSDSGNYYVRTDLNEVPVALLPDRVEVYIPWQDARDYLMRCVPLYYQL